MTRQSMWASELVGRRVETVAGRSIGRVVDLAFAPREGGRVTCIYVGRSTFLGRFSILRSAPHPILGFGATLAIDWGAVLRVDADRVVVRDEEVRT
jgi:sporulation protein YlmC with PRC-barrel domain